MFEFIVIVAIIGAVWFYLRKKKNATEGSAPEPDKKPATAQVSTEKPEPIPTPEPVKAKPVAVTEASEPVSVIPEDSMLRRHYMQNLTAQQDVDSSSAADSEDLVVKEVAIPASIKTEIPVEKEVKRDVIQQLVAETEATMPPRPTDSALKRHYDTQLMSVVLSKLQESK